MPPTRLATDVFGVATIALVSLTAVLGLLCIYLSLYIHFCIQRKRFPHLSYFNGPWLTRIFLILIAILWGFGEIIRLSFLNSRLFWGQTWQNFFCKFYILTNLGFAEPSMFLMLTFLLNAALQKRESGTLSRRWNGKTLSYVILLCMPIMCIQLVLVLVGPRFNNEPNGEKRKKMEKFFLSAYLTNNVDICTYPLLSTIILGAFYTLLISYIVYVAFRMLTLVINKVLRRRIYMLMLSVSIFLPLRVILLGFSVFPQPGNLAYEIIVFLAFLVLVLCAMTGICMLVYLPVADSLALRDVGRIELEGIPYDDYYYDGASLIANQSHQEVSRSASKHSSLSFRIMNKDEIPAPDITSDPSFFQNGPLETGRPMFPLREMAEP